MTTSPIDNSRLATMEMLIAELVVLEEKRHRNLRIVYRNLRLTTILMTLTLAVLIVLIISLLA